MLIGYLCVENLLTWSWCVENLLTYCWCVDILLTWYWYVAKLLTCFWCVENLLTCCWCVEMLTYGWCVLLVCWEQGSIFRSENDIYSPPLMKMIFFPLLGHVVFRLPSWPFCLNSSLFCNYFTLLVPLFSFLSPFFLFFYIYPFFSLPFHIFSPKWHWLTFPPPPGRGGYFPIYMPLVENMLTCCRCVGNLMTSGYVKRTWWPPVICREPAELLAFRESAELMLLVLNLLTCCWCVYDLLLMCREPANQCNGAETICFGSSSVSGSDFPKVSVSAPVTACGSLLTRLLGGKV